MKNLIRKISYAICIMLLTCTFCLAQDLTIIEYNNTEILRVSHDSTEVMCGGVELITVKLLVKYETECYNDSVQATYDFYVWDNDTIKSHPSIDPGFTQGYIGTKMIYEHKEPTFKDFVRWAAKKYGL